MAEANTKFDGLIVSQNKNNSINTSGASTTRSVGVPERPSKDISPLIFPKTLNKNLFIEFNAFNYTKDPKYKKIVKRNFNYDKSIYLPMPSTISDAFGASWEGAALGIVGELIRQGTAATISDVSLQNLIDSPSQSLTTMKENAANFIRGLGREEAAGVLTSALTSPQTALTNAVKTNFNVTENPFAIMTYNGVGFKQHQFSWTLYPESKEESVVIKKIVNYFRREMLPEKLKTNRYLLSYPAIFEIRLHPNKNTMRFKRCVLTDMSINYTPNGLAFFKTEKDTLETSSSNAIEIFPASVSLSLTFKEIEIWTADDFSSNEEDSFDYVDSSNQTVKTQDLEV